MSDTITIVYNWIIMGREGEVIGTENFREDEKRSLEYLYYPGRPHIMEAKSALENGVIRFLNDGTAIILDQLTDKEVKIGKSHQYSLVEATIYGLNEALVKAEQGKSLREILDNEIIDVDNNYSTYGDLSHYGVYAYYPNSDMLAQFAPSEIHDLALVSSTSRLLQDEEMKMEWTEVRSKLKDVVVGFAGTSVGNRIAHSITMDLRPKEIKVADPSNFKLTNFNRVQGAFWDVVYSNEQADKQITVWGLKNKAIGLAEQIHSLDPFMKVWTYFDGVNEENISSFVAGNCVEPKPQFVIEETDDPNMKVRIREKCREYGVRIIMASDAGSTVQVDIRPFDIDPEATLAFGISDEELYGRKSVAKARPKDKKAFFGFVDALLGTDYKRDEFGAIIRGDLPRVFASIPQLGSTASLAAALVTEVVSRTSLGYKFPERFLIDKNRLEIESWGKLV